MRERFSSRARQLRVDIKPMRNQKWLPANQTNWKLNMVWCFKNNFHLEGFFQHYSTHQGDFSIFTFACLEKKKTCVALLPLRSLILKIAKLSLTFANKDGFFYILPRKYIFQIRLWFSSKMPFNEITFCVLNRRWWILQIGSSLFRTFVMVGF